MSRLVWVTSASTCKYLRGENLKFQFGNLKLNLGSLSSRDYIPFLEIFKQKIAVTPKSFNTDIKFGKGKGPLVALKKLHHSETCWSIVFILGRRKNIEKGKAVL